MFQELVWMMTNYQDPIPNSIAKRFKLNNHDWIPEVSIAEYIAELRWLTEHCIYGQGVSQEGKKLCVLHELGN